MNCPMCGESWNGYICGECLWTEGPKPPRWWKRCVAEGHETSVLEPRDGVIEFFCGDCCDGAGKGERITRAGVTA